MQALEAQIAALSASATLAASHPTTVEQTFTGNLALYDQGPEVLALQQFLNSHGFPVATSGPGSPGEETSFFGFATYHALVSYQAANDLPATGYFGPETRALISGTAGTSAGTTNTPASSGQSQNQSTTTQSATMASASSTPSSLPALPSLTFGGGGEGGGGGSAAAPAPDTTPPTVSITAPTASSTVSGSAVTLTASASDNVAVKQVQFAVDGTNIGSAITSSPYTTAWDSTGVSDGTYTLSAVAEDSSGNYATSSISVTVENTAVSISSIATTSVSNANATVTWTTNEAATSELVYGTTSSYGSSTSSASLATSHGITITGLTASTTYDYAIVSTNAAGNAATSSNQTLTTQTGLLGVNISGPEFAPWDGQAFPNSADFAYLARKGVTFVRLPIAWESLQPTLGGSLNSTYLGKIESAIAAAHADGISVIVDLHNSGAYCQQADWASSGCGYAGNGGSTGTGVDFLGDGTLTQADFTNLWTQLATALVGTPGLKGYGIMNEPSMNILQYGTNLLFAPNGFADEIGSQPWFTINAGVLTQLAVGTNPLGSSYGPAWSLSSGSGYGGVAQYVTLGSGSYTLSIYLKSSVATNLCAVIGSDTTSWAVTTSWQRFTYTAAPGAGSQEISFCNEGPDFSGNGAAIDMANAQLELGSSATAYVPNPYLPYAQAAITAIRAVDVSTPIYVDGFDDSSAYQWPWVNWELDTLTGGNLVFDAHEYFDGSVSQGGGGGGYSGTYSSYSITSSAGVQEVAPFESWLASTTESGYLGEYAIPDNSKGDQASWMPVMTNFLQSLIANDIPSTMWYYGAPGLQPSNILGISTSTTANAGNDDPRLTQMLEQY